MTHRVPVRAKRQWRSILVIIAATLGAYTDGDAQPLGPCFGDCDGNGQVTVAELVTGVDITLDLTPLDQCPEFDTGADQRVTVDELGQAVNAAIEGCVTPTETATPLLPSATPTATESPSPTPSASPTASASPTLTPTPMSPTPSATSGSTPGDVAKSVAGHASVAANAMGAIPSVITSIVSGFQFGGGASASLDTEGLQAFAMDDGGAAGSCPNGGTAVRSCTPSGFGSVTITITLTNCGVDTPDGSGTFSGTITLAGTGFCPAVLPPATLTINLQGTFEDQSSNPTLNVSANLTGAATAIQLGGSCYLTGITLTLNGSLSAAVPDDGGTTVTFDNTIVNATVSQFNADCVPLIYTLTFNGGAAFTETSSGDSFDATFDDFMFTQDATSSPTEVQLSGGMSSTCFGGAVTIATVEPLLSQYGTPCFTGGVLEVTSESGTERVIYSAGGGVGIDANLDGTPEQTYASCLAPELLTCSP